MKNDPVWESPGSALEAVNNVSLLLTYTPNDPVKLLCEIDLDRLLPTEAERRRFHDHWEAFLSSDKHHPMIFNLQGRKLTYESEQLIPSKTDKRPPLLLVFGNPAGHSVHEGMFFAFEGNRKEHRFWKDILKPAGLFQPPKIDRIPAAGVNGLRRQQLLELSYKGPYRIGLCVFISIPSAPGGKWGGIAGVQKLFGAKALRRLESEEARRIHDCANRFIGRSGKVVVFQKNAWNGLRSPVDPEYRIDLAKSGSLRGRLKHAPGIEILGVPPTRLSGPCQRALKTVI